MSRVLYVDVIGGAAGDMLLAALIDAGAPLDAIRDAVEAVVPGRFVFETEVVRRGGIRARLLRIGPGPSAPGADDLTGRPLGQLLEAIERADLELRVRSAARSVVERIGKAEAMVHGIDVGELSLHELGDDDTLLDVVGIAAALSAMDVDEILVSAIPLGSGRPAPGRHLHGNVPLPAAVTIELLRGFSVRGEGWGETVTPTAAAVFAALGSDAARFPSMTIESIGYGAGNDDPPDRANVVRVILGSQATSPSSEADGEPGVPRVRELVVLEASLDDLSSQLMADAARAILLAGALDVWTTPAQMKKGRPGFVLTALCDPLDEARIRTLFFETTPTLGVRSHAVRRAELERRLVAVPIEGGSVRVKIALLHGRVVTATPEHDDVASIAANTGRSVRDVHEEATAAARALRLQEADA